jgi:hypothetical protein
MPGMVGPKPLIGVVGMYGTLTNGDGHGIAHCAGHSGRSAYLFPADRNQSIISSGEVPEGRSPRRRRPKQLT